MALLALLLLLPALPARNDGALPPDLEKDSARDEDKDG